MKTNILLAVSAVLTIIILAAGVQSDNGIAGKTGSPGETTCNTATCHNSFTLNSGTGSVTFTCDNMPGWLYTGGTTYHMHFKVKRVGSHLFGLGVEALDSAGRNAGTMNITDATRTTSKLATISGNSRKSITHKLNGGAATDSVTFNFDWVAPVTGVGVTFYCAGNCTNANGSPLGDYIYTTTQFIAPNFTAGIASLEENMTSSVYPNPAHSRIALSYHQQESGLVSIRLYGIDGSLTREFVNEVRTAGEHHDEFENLDELKSGIYYLRVVNGIHSVVQKVVLL